MNITRIQIESGFLNGFDLELSPGLNVLIGARGTGKTSVIELLRYALAAKNHTALSQSRSLEHARAVLDGGEVTVEIGDWLADVTVTRSADDDAPRSNGEFMPPIVLSQMEIETLGLSTPGRLALIDQFVSARGALRDEEASVVSSIRSIYKEIAALEAEISNLSDGKPAIAALVIQLAELKKQQALFQGQSKGAAEKQAVLAKYNVQLADISVRTETIGRFETDVARWSDALSRLSDDDFGPDLWEGHDDPDPLSGLRDTYKKLVRDVTRISGEFETLRSTSGARLNELKSRAAVYEKEARGIRTELDKLADGSGALERQVSGIQTQIAQQQSREKITGDRRLRLTALRSKRNQLLSSMQNVRTKRAEARAAVASEISAKLTPHIKVELEISAQYQDYAKAIADALRGSGMKYAEIASTLSQLISPRELIEMVEQANFIALAEITSIPKERAARLLGHLKDVGCVDIATCNIDDDVRMSLLDGIEHKDIASLSAGQRCTVILSIVLQHKERTLVIDQPEDHLDNAFIATTVIKALLDRKGHGQVILSTHNANIPVLGSADLVIEMTSDGRNGFLQLSRPLDDPAAVDAITTVMEGGREAFATRAAFYENHNPS